MSHWFDFTMTLAVDMRGERDAKVTCPCGWFDQVPSSDDARRVGRNHARREHNVQNAIAFEEATA